MPKLADLLTNVLRRMADDLVEAKNDVAVAKNEETRLGKLTNISARAADEWESRAMAAVRAGDDVVAKEALVRKREHQREAEDFRAALHEQHEEVERLTTVLSGLNLRLEQAKGKATSVISRARRARAAESIASLIERSEDVAPLELLGRAEMTLAAIEDRAALLPELSDQALESSAAAGDSRVVDAELLLVKTEAAKAETKPLAKAMGAPSTRGLEPARASRERRTKR
jgi:phage shock protein A